VRLPRVRSYQHHALSKAHSHLRGDLSRNAEIRSFSTIDQVAQSGLGALHAVAIRFYRDMRGTIGSEHARPDVLRPHHVWTNIRQQWRRVRTVYHCVCDFI